MCALVAAGYNISVMSCATLPTDWCLQCLRVVHGWLMMALHRLATRQLLLLGQASTSIIQTQQLYMSHGVKQESTGCDGQGSNQC